MSQRHLPVPPTADGQRLDSFLAAALPELSRARVQRLIQAGDVQVDGRPCRRATRLRAGEAITLSIPPPQQVALVAEELPLAVVYEDDDLLVVDKPAGLVAHPAPGHPRGTLANAVLGHWRGERAVGSDGLRLGLVHRLDKDTSGLVVVARHPAAQADLVRQMQQGHVEKRYLALVRGQPSPSAGVVDAPIGRDPRDRTRMAVRPQGRPARTRYRTVELLGRYALLELTLETGRTHQIRVHCRAIGHPIVGDPVYGVVEQRLGLARQFLHAAALRFAHPRDGRPLAFTSALPPDLAAALAEARRLAAAE
ncbi:MAG: RluA family pseudouridine synthase [Chloroflexi bacterium]|nr:RluA family pseudouridine synthase [Chloroflexota bacterium]